MSALVFIIDLLKISDISHAKYHINLSVQKLQQYSPNASVFIFQPKVNLMTINQQEEVQKTLDEFLSSGVKKHIQYFSDANEIVQKLREIA